MEAAAGFAEVDITPPVGVALVGYHRPSPSTGVLDRLAATSLVLEAGPTRLVMISVDHIGMTVPHATRMRERIARALGVGTSQVMLLFTHTHSGPETEDDVPLHREYREVLAARLERVAAEAAGRLRPCRVAWGITSGRIGVNRRLRGPDGRARYGVNEHGPVDDRIGVLRVDDAESGRLLGLLVICAAHGTVLRGDSTLISADFPGWARRLLAKALGCPVIVANGAAGNINPRWRGSVADLERMAMAVAGPVLGLLPELRAEPLARLWTGSATVDARLVPVPPPEETARLAAVVAREWGCPAEAWLHLVTRLYQEGLRELSLPVEVHLARINDGFIAGVPVEPFAELALELRRRCRRDVAFLLGCANGLYGYLPTAEEFRRGGYEVEWMPVCYGHQTGLVMPFEPGTAGRILQEVLRLWKAST